MSKFLDGLSDQELRDMFTAQQQLEQQLKLAGPQTDDELHAWIVENLGIDVSRTAVCENHNPPFNFIADIYFERVDSAMLLANRAGGKTFSMAVIHWVNSMFKPGMESVTFAAIEAQSLIAYSHMKNWIYDKEGNKRPEIKASMMRETTFSNGSIARILGSTPESVNGPHPQLAHADEVELMREDTYSESRNMTSGKRLGNGRVVRPQDIYTSTRKGPNGRMQKLIDEIEEAKQAGLKPPRVLYQHCLKESAAQNPGCQVARPDLPEDQACDCNKVAKGQWENGQTRYLKDVCGGDFHRSRGWQPFTDVIKQFTENDKETFEVQQLCAKPEMRHHYVPNWQDDRHLVRDYTPDPDNGPIFTSVDFGGTNPHSVHWYQLLRHEVEALAWNQPDEPDEPMTIRIKEGTLVCFDEIYIAEIGNDKLGDLVIQKENEYKKQFPNFKPWARFADPQGKAARMDWKEKGLKTSWHTTREFEEHIKILRDMFDDDLFRCDGQKCPMFVKEIKEWRADPKSGNQIDYFNHAMSDCRYSISNIKKIKARALGTHGNLPTSRSIARKSGPGVRISRPTQGPIATRGTGNEMDNWRKSLGGPVRRNS
jgi:hypothetical protein